MKIVLTMILVAICALAGFAQADFEKDFEKNKLKYKLEKFSQGEDASSGYDYFFYKDKTQIVKVREVWSSSANPTHRIEDYFYSNGKLIAVLKYTFDKKYYRTAERGRNVPSKLVEKLVFADSKLANWTENGLTVAPTDKRWQEKEKDAFEAGKSQLENYNFMKENN